MEVRNRNPSSPAKENAGSESSKKVAKGRTWGESFQYSVLHTVVGPLFLMSVTPATIIFTWLICVNYGGSLENFATKVTLAQLTSLDFYPKPTIEAAKLILGFAAMEIVFLVALPGKTFSGAVTRTGHQPTYRLNGVLAFFVTHFVLYYLTFHLKWFSLAIVYDHFGSILQTLSLTSFVVCFLLFLKGLYAPSSLDSGSSGNIIMDFFWGTELHPQIGPLNLKQFSNCRFGMMGWSVIINCFLVKQLENLGYVSNSMIISTIIQQFYILKFFYWESGYFNTLDMMYDRLGFYIYWGVTCWIPGIYCLVSLYLVDHPLSFETPQALAITGLGILSVLVNYDCDIQRIRVRETDGKCLVWGKKPTIIKAQYQTSDGKTRENLLLASGWWGVSRHVHYIPEILLSAAWTLPATFNHALPWFYVVYLTILLVHRLGRDEIRCSEKYGSYWKKYCQEVPYRLIPYIY